MSSSAIDRPVQFSVFDRLLLGESDRLEAGESDIGRLREFILRDLRWLLNTRRSPTAISDRYPLLQESVLAYGFVDLLSLGRDSPQVRTRLREPKDATLAWPTGAPQIEDTLTLFEPRLTNLRVSEPTAPVGARHQLRFVISASLRADPVPIQLSFDTVIDKLKGEVGVEEGGSAR